MTVADVSKLHWKWNVHVAITPYQLNIDVRRKQIPLFKLKIKAKLGCLTCRLENFVGTLCVVLFYLVY